MTPAERIFERLPGETEGEIGSPPPWSEAKESTFQSPDDPALIISDKSKRDLLKKLADNYRCE